MRSCSYCPEQKLILLCEHAGTLKLFPQIKFSDKFIHDKPINAHLNVHLLVCHVSIQHSLMHGHGTHKRVFSFSWEI
jgi:hypothetical protein